jgi:hypothetical protein
MQMGCTFAEGHDVDPITASEAFDDATCMLHGTTPICGLISVEANRTTHMSACIEQQPADQRRRIGMMSKDPQWSSADFIELSTASISVKATDIAAQKISQGTGV